MLGLITPSEGEIIINDKKLDSENRINLLSMMNLLLLTLNCQRN